MTPSGAQHAVHLLALAGLLCGCSEFWDRNNECASGCPSGTVCSKGECIAVEAGSVDGPSVDGPSVDGGTPDGPIIDWLFSSCSVDGWCLIPAGTFDMGSKTDEPCRRSNETWHPVTLTRGFYLQQTEVTQAQFFDRMGYSPQSPVTGCANCPVVNVSWHEAVAYCNALSAVASLTPCYEDKGTHDVCTKTDDCPNKSGGDMCDPDTKECIRFVVASGFTGSIHDCPGFRLPTEAEWEYAYRAGTQTAYYVGDYDGPSDPCFKCETLVPNAQLIGWHCANAGSQIHQVGQLAPNSWGLCDMAGNAWEWCQDWHKDDLGTGQVTNPESQTGAFKAYRGGSVHHSASCLRAAYRPDDKIHLPIYNFEDLGFRCARTKL